MRKRFNRILVVLLAVSAVICGIIGLYGCKKKDERTVSFMVDGEVYYTFQTGGKEYVEMPENPDKANYIFDGWYVDDGSWEVPFKTDNLIDRELTQDLKVFAKWNNIAEKVIAFDEAAAALSFDFSYYQTYESADLSGFDSSYYNKDTKILTIPATYGGKELKTIEIKGAYGTLDDKNREILTEFNGVALSFEQGSGTQKTIKLNGIAINAPAGEHAVNLSAYSGSTVSLEIAGKVKLTGGSGTGSASTGNSGIYAGNLNITGYGNLSVFGGNGLNGDSADSVSYGSAGGDGIHADNLSISNASVYACGGVGGNGSNNDTGVGFNGGDGGNGIFVSKSFTVGNAAQPVSTNLQLLGGNGGNGGNGAKGSTGATGIEDKWDAEPRRGGTGGTGYEGGTSGKGGYGLKTEQSAAVSINTSAAALLKGGNGGNGGNGGKGGDGGKGANGFGTQWNGAGGNGGDGGKGGNAYKGQSGCNTVINVNVQNGSDGIVGKGGAAGEVGADGKNGVHTDSVNKTKGAQGVSGSLLEA